MIITPFYGERPYVAAVSSWMRASSSIFIFFRYESSISATPNTCFLSASTQFVMGHHLRKGEVLRIYMRSSDTCRVELIGCRVERICSVFGGERAPCAIISVRSSGHFAPHHTLYKL